eukprot:EG_transcript_14586
MDLLDYYVPLADPNAVYYQESDTIRQLFQEIPQLAPFYTHVETVYDPVPVHQWMISHPGFPFIAISLYLCLCYFGPKYMNDLKPFNLKYSLVLWNGALSLFSLVGTLRTVPHLLWLLTNTPFRDTVCRCPYQHWGSGATGMWIQFFILSKFPELGDTVFIVLKKKPLIFLHWYHHVTVLLFCWHSYITESSTGIYFASMNYLVHSIMYFYYGAMAYKLPMKWFPAELLTALQILQMVLGVFIISCSWYYTATATPENPCSSDRGNQLAGILMYLSYLLLFMKFFVDKYIFGSTGAMSVPRMGRKKDL